MTRQKTRYELRTYKGDSRYYIIEGRRRIRTCYRHDQETEFLEFFARRVKPQAAGSLCDVTFEELDKWCMGGHYPIFGDFRISILSHWRGTIGKVSQTTIDEYVVARQQEISPRTGKPYSLGTALAEAAVLMAAIRKYAAAHHMYDIPSVTVSKPDQQPFERVLTKAEFARLLWATLGYQWDPNASAMKKTEGRKYDALRKRGSYLRRLILLLTYTGSDANCALRLQWKPTTDQSFVDVPGHNSVGFLQRAILHRLGNDQPRAEKLRNLPVLLGRRISAHLKRWRRLDGPFAEYVVHIDGKKMEYLSLSRRLASLVATAGLDEVAAQTLTATFSAWALQHGATIRSLSMSVGISGKTLRKTHAHFQADFHAEALKAFRARPQSICG